MDDNQCDKDILQNQKDPYTLQLNSNVQNTPMDKEPFSNNFQTKKIEIPFSIKYSKIFFYLFIFISSLIFSLSVISIKTVYGPIFFIIEFLVILYFDNYKIVIIKDEFKNKINIKVINYFFIKRKNFKYDLGNVYFNVVYFCNKYIFLIVNNCKIGPENDFNTPFQIYFYENINLNKFKGQNQLNNILNDFLRVQGNPLNSNSDMNNQENNLNQSNDNEYLAINNQFYIYYNIYPLIKKNGQNNSVKSFIIFIHFIIILFGIIILLSDDDDDGIFSKKEMLFAYSFLYFVFCFICILFGLCVCFIKSYNFNKSCLRIDIKFSFNFDKIFIGSLNPNKDTYNTTSEFDINEIDRFILQNNNEDELKVKFKGGLSKTVCYINNQHIGFQGLLNILNPKIADNKNYNNAEQQHLNDYIPPLAITPD